MSSGLSNIPADYLSILIPIQTRAPYTYAVGIIVVGCNPDATGLAPIPSLVWLEDIVIEV